MAEHGWFPKDPHTFIADVFARKGRITLAKLHGGTEKRCRFLAELIRSKGSGAFYSRWLAANPGTALGTEADNSSEQESRTLLDDGAKQEIDLRGTRICTLEELMEHCKVDLDVWKVDRFTVNKWEVGAKDSNKDVQIHPLFQVKATLSKREGVESVKEVIARLFDEASSRAPIYKPNLRVVRNGKNLLEINPIDHHLGKLAWKPEAGQNYDLKIARRLFEQSIQHLVSKAVHGNSIDRILLILGNDLLQMDNAENTTTAGTHVDVEGRFAKVYFEACEMVKCTIDEYLLPHADVDILMVPGNHDRYTTFHLGEYLKAWYRNCDQVNVDNSPTARKYYEWGETMFLYTHGDTAKLKDLPQIMATEQKQMWGRTTFRFAKTGHLHTKRLFSRIDIDEHFGVQTMICPTLCASDEWHAVNGFVGNIRRSEAYVYHERTGLDAYYTFHALED